MQNEHNHEEEFEYDVIGIPLEDGTELNCIVIDIFDVEGENYIALIPEDEIEDGELILLNIKNFQKKKLNLLK